MSKLFAASLAALLLSACATATPYQQATKHTSGEGYSDQQIENDRWRVTFSGNEITSKQTVESYMLFRAAELTLEHGFDWFETADRSTEAQVVDYGYGGYYGGDGWWGPYADNWRPYWSYDNDWGSGTAYQVQANILVHHGQKPKGDLHAFDAREVVAHIGPHIIRPKPEG